MGFRKVVVGLLALALLVGCKGPETAPHQPIPGVDTPENDVDNPHDKDTGRREQSRRPGDPPVNPVTDRSPEGSSDPDRRFLKEFISRVVAAHEAVPGDVAVFPALTPVRNQSPMIVTGLGDHLARETALELQMHGIRAWWSSTLDAELRKRNRDLGSVQSITDVFSLASRIGAEYVIYGQVDLKVLARMQRDQYLDVQWNCLRISDRALVARLDERLSEGPLAKEYHLYYEMKGERIAGVLKDDSLDREVDTLSSMLVRRLLSEHRAMLAGRRFKVQPTRIHTLEGPRSELQSWAAAYQGKLEELIRRAAKDGKEDPEAAAMRYGPVVLRGRTFENLTEAQVAFDEMFESLKTGASWGLSLEIAESISEHLLKQLGDEASLQPSDRARQDMLALIGGETSAIGNELSIDPRTVARLRTGGTEVLVASSLLPALEDFRLRISLHDLNSGASISDSVVIGSQYSDRLRAITRQ